MAWGKRTAPLPVPRTKERERQPSYGARNLLTPEVHFYAAPTGNGGNTGAYLHWCQPLYPAKPWVFLWDGASYPRGQDLQEFLAETKGGVAEADWKVTCLRFAPNAPEQHPTEDVWLKGKTHLRKPCALKKTFAQVQRCFSTFLSTLRFTSTKLRWYWPTEQMI